MLLIFILLLGRLELYYSNQPDDSNIRDISTAAIKKIRSVLGTVKVDATELENS